MLCSNWGHLLPCINASFCKVKIILVVHSFELQSLFICVRIKLEWFNINSTSFRDHLNKLVRHIADVVTSIQEAQHAISVAAHIHHLVYVLITSHL